MVRVRTPAGVVRRHVDQLRKRECSTPTTGSDQEPEWQASNAGTTSDHEQSPTPSIEQRGIAAPDPEVHPEVAASNAPMAVPDTQAQVLRRSTRQRKPVQRLQYP
ncbi:hypothetical protein MTO96_000635 [Rhipicephalus appendiculatus]